MVDSLILSPNNLLEELKRLKENYIMLLDICAREEDGELTVVYHLLDMEKHQRLRIYVSATTPLPSAVSIWPNAQWYEREIHEMFGVSFQVTLEKLLLHTEMEGFPLRKNFDSRKRQRLSTNLNIDKEMQQESKDYLLLNVGPFHPLTIGGPRMMAALDDEVVKKIKMEVGYLHRGVEKICEQSKYNEIIPYIERLNYYASAMNSLGICKAIEDLMDIEIPARAQLIRMIFAELSRVIHHLHAIARLSTVIGVIGSVTLIQEQIEKLYDLCAQVCGVRLNFSLNRIGGVAYDLPLGWISAIFELLKSIGPELNQIDRLLTKSKVWVDRTKIASIPAEDAIRWGCTGPTLRASGINYDIRKRNPYYFYRDVEFEIPLGVYGHAYDRYLVWMEEIRQSFRIIAQLLDNIPSGSIMTEDERLIPSRSEIRTNTTAKNMYFKIGEKGISPARGEIYSMTEAANGELGFYLCSDGSSKPARLKIRSPSFSLCQFFPEIASGLTLSDLLVAFVSLNINVSEVDR